MSVKCGHGFEVLFMTALCGTRTSSDCTNEDELHILVLSSREREREREEVMNNINKVKPKLKLLIDNTSWWITLFEKKLVFESIP